MRYLGNAFSAGMLATNTMMSFQFLTTAQAKAWVQSPQNWTSCVGHADTANLVSTLLGVKVVLNRCTTELHYGDQLLIAQYNGTRLPEGATSLPEGATLRWILATLEGEV
jgi:hypothetical protein